jgi:TMEM175 potassium channel family protein
MDPSENNQMDFDHHPRGYGLERLIFFSDGVFAIAITLLALDIRLPEGIGLRPAGELALNLGSMWQKYIAYVISFLVIGSFWISHHRKFRYIQRYDRTLLNLNLLILMVVAFIPFSSSLISISSDITATVFYSATMIVGSIMVVLLWRYASGRGKLVPDNLDPKVIKRETMLPLVTGGIFLLSIGIAFINPDLAKLSWVLILLVAFLFQRD